MLSQHPVKEAAIPMRFVGEREHHRHFTNEQTEPQMIELHIQGRRAVNGKGELSSVSCQGLLQTSYGVLEKPGVVPMLTHLLPPPKSRREEF